MPALSPRAAPLRRAARPRSPFGSAETTTVPPYSVRRRRHQPQPSQIAPAGTAVRCPAASRPPRPRRRSNHPAPAPPGRRGQGLPCLVRAGPRTESPHQAPRRQRSPVRDHVRSPGPRLASRSTLDRRRRRRRDGARCSLTLAIITQTLEGSRDELPISQCEASGKPEHLRAEFSAIRITWSVTHVTDVLEHDSPDDYFQPSLTSAGLKLGLGVSFLGGSLGRRRRRLPRRREAVRRADRRGPRLHPARRCQRIGDPRSSRRARLGAQPRDPVEPGRERREAQGCAGSSRGPRRHSQRAVP